MPQTYISVIDTEGNVLVARKKVYGTFFKGKPINKETPPYQVLNGAGQYVFNGGKLDYGEKPEAGALREFKEETGIDLETIGGKILKTEKINNAFYFTVFCLSSEKLNEFAESINGNIHKGLDGGIIDDELSEVCVVKIINAGKLLGVRQKLEPKDQGNVDHYINGKGPYKKSHKDSQSIDWYGVMAKFIIEMI